MNLEENSIMTEHSEPIYWRSFFFDTYAFYEIFKENKNYESYMDSAIITTKLNIFELYHKFLKLNNEDLANIYLKEYYKFVVDFDENTIEDVAKLKILLNKRDVSMTDCIGYCLAKQLGIKFLTGDEAFENLENVEFVK